MSREWLLALESSTSHGGAALLRGGETVDTVRLAEGLRHGRELVSSAASLLERRGMTPRELAGVAVSFGPGSYTGLRVGVMAAKALAYGTGCRLLGVSSLAALAQSRVLGGEAGEGDTVVALQNARRDEVYAGVYRIVDGVAQGLAPDAAVSPEEAAARCRDLLAGDGGRVRLAGSGFAAYHDVFAAAVPDVAGAGDGAVLPDGVGVLAWRQFLREEFADPMTLQPVYLRRDEGADWRHDHLITS